MDPLLLRILVIMNVLLAISTVVNVIHKLTIINGPNAHIAIAILSLLVLFGYSGVLNTMFLKRRFHLGRKLYLAVAGLSQVTILVLSFLSYYGVMTYFDAIAIIHALMGFITILNFTCTVLVVDEQQKQIQEDQKHTKNKKLKNLLETYEEFMKKISMVDEHSTKQPLLEHDKKS